MKLFYSFATTLILIASQPALAADMAAPEPSPVADVKPVFSWSGFYAGVHGGYGWGDADYEFPFAFGEGPHYSFFNNEAGDRFSHSITP